MPRGRELLICAAAVTAVLLSRLAHRDVVWIEEAYGIAAARELLAGNSLYTEIWFDKPPGYALYYALIGGQSGLALRLTGTFFVVLTAWTAWNAAGRLWSRHERVPAFVFTCLSLTFWIPSAVQAITPDLLMLPFLLGALSTLLAGWPVLGGVLAGLALWCNTKSLVLAAPLVLWCVDRNQVFRLLGGYVGVQALGWLLLDAAAYAGQVWVWGIRYSRDTFVDSPVREFFRRTGGWLWFHSSLVLSGLRSSRQEARLVIWLAAGLLAVCAGARFFPRYYFALLPPLVLLGARGWVLSGRRVRVAVLLLAAVPIVRFGPRYVELLRDRNAAQTWSDLNLMHDSRAVAQSLRKIASPDATVLVWGYRPDVYVFSGLQAATQFLDSQPLNGVLADRHLTVSKPTFPDLARLNRQKLLESPAPSFIVDGLGAMNPDLAIERYEDLGSLLRSYRVVAKTTHSTIYKLQSPN